MAINKFEQFFSTPLNTLVWLNNQPLRLIPIYALITKKYLFKSD